MRNNKTPLVVLAVAALSAPLFTSPAARAEAPPPVAAAQPSVAVYALVGGVPVNVSATASYGEGQVYLAGVWLGSLTPSGAILGGNGVLVGFVASVEG